MNGGTDIDIKRAVVLSAFDRPSQIPPHIWHLDGAPDARCAPTP